MISFHAVNAVIAVKDSAEPMSRSGISAGYRPISVLTRTVFCIFFDKEKQCTIHPVKPYMCKAWPFIDTVIRHPENWNMMANSCPGMKKDIPKEALEKIVGHEKEKLHMSIPEN